MQAQAALQHTREAEDAELAAQERRRKENAIENRRLERKDVAITYLKDTDFSKSYGIGWKEDKIETIRFSGPQYRLETLTKPEPFCGLMNKGLIRAAVKHVDVSKNCIQDVDFFHSSNGWLGLETLTLRHNEILNMSITNATLVQLDLAHNLLAMIPPLDGLPLLTVLLLSHNRICGNMQAFQKCKRLSRIDVAWNAYDLTPSQLDREVELLSRLGQLKNLRLFHNPFVAFFPEYQVFVLKRLATLQYLDDVRITPTLLKDVRMQPSIPHAERLDDIYAARKEEHQAQESKEEEGGSLASFPRMEELTQFLEESLEDPHASSFNIEEIRRRAEHGMREAMNVDVDSTMLEQELWSGQRNPAATISHFLELVRIVLERHEQLRYAIFMTLGCLGAFCRADLGEKCMGLLGALMMYSNEACFDGCRIIKETLMPTFQSLQQKTMNQHHAAICLGIVNILKRWLLEDENPVAEAISDALPDLAALLCKPDRKDNWLIAKLMAHATDNQKNVGLIESEELANVCVSIIENQSLQKKVYDLEDETKQSRDLWLDILMIFRHLATFGKDTTFKFLKDCNVHVGLVARAKEARAPEIGIGNGRTPLLLSCVIHALTAMMSRDAEVLRVISDVYKFKYELVENIKRDVHPLVMEACCRSLTVLLSDKEMLRKCTNLVLEDLARQVPLLAYLGGKKYKEFRQRALDDDDEVNRGKHVHPSLKDEDNPHVIAAWVAIVDHITFWVDPDVSESDCANQVNEAMDMNKREDVLLSLLQVNSFSVKLAVMRCIRKVPLHQLDKEEMSRIIKLISDTRNMAAGKTEEVLQLVLEVLGGLASDSGQSGNVFREVFAEATISEAVQLISLNSARTTWCKEEEEEKSNLSIAVISFLGACGRYHDLRHKLDNDGIRYKAVQVLQNEDKTHSLESASVCMEQVWTCRAVERIIDDLFIGGARRGNNTISSYKRPLNRRGKVAFRMIVRIADVFEGQSDGDRPTKGLTHQELADREIDMWDDERVRRQLCRLNDDERTERKTSVQVWMETDGLSRLLNFAQGVDSGDTDSDELHRDAMSFVDDIALAWRKGSTEAEQLTTEHRRTHITIEDLMEENIQSGNGEAMLMSALQTVEDRVDPIMHSLFVTSPPNDTIVEATFVDEKGIEEEGQQKSVNRALTMSAVLRVIHAVLLVPPTEKCRRTLVRELRLASTVRKLVQLTRDLHPLACNIGAKLLWVLAEALDTRCHCDIPAPGLGVFYFLSHGYVLDVLNRYLPIVRLTKDVVLSPREQLLGSEAAHFSVSVTRAVQSYRQLYHSAKSSTNRGRGREERFLTGFLKDVTQRLFIPHSSNSPISLFVALAIYRLQEEGGRTPEGYASGCSGGACFTIGAKLHVMELLVLYMVLCPDDRYDTLEEFCIAETFEQMTVRPSFLNDLLSKVDLEKFRCHVGHFLRSRPGASESERVLHMSIVTTLDHNSYMRDVTTCLLCATTSSLFLLAPDESQPAFAHMEDSGKWNPSWEAEHPRDPHILWERGYHEIRAFYRCFVPQLMAITWKAQDGDQSFLAQTALGKNPIGRRLFKRSSEKQTALAFNDFNDREQFLHCMKHFDTPSRDVRVGEEITFSIQTDHNITSAVKAQLGDDSRVLAATVHPRSGLNSGLDLCVLTMSEVATFRITLGSWILPDAHAPDEDWNHLHVFHQPERGELEEDDQSCPLVKLRRPCTALQQIRTRDRERAVRLQESNVGVEDMRDGTAGEVLASDIGVSDFSSEVDMSVCAKIEAKDLSRLSEVVFETPDVDLTLAFGGSRVSIKFFDDAAREWWRWGLAQHLSHKSGWERSHA